MSPFPRLNAPVLAQASAALWLAGIILIWLCHCLHRVMITVSFAFRVEHKPITSSPARSPGTLLCLSSLSLSLSTSPSGRPVSTPFAECLFVRTSLLIQEYCGDVTSPIPSSTLFFLLCCQSPFFFFGVHVCVQTGAQTKEGCLWLEYQ